MMQPRRDVDERSPCSEKKKKKKKKKAEVAGLKDREKGVMLRKSNKELLRYDRQTATTWLHYPRTLSLCLCLGLSLSSLFSLSPPSRALSLRTLVNI